MKGGRKNYQKKKNCREGERTGEKKEDKKEKKKKAGGRKKVWGIRHRIPVGVSRRRLLRSVIVRVN